MRHLRAGHSPKFIALQLGVTVKCIQKVLVTSLEHRREYIATYPLRYPNKEAPPPKIMEPLKVIVG